VMLTAGEIDQLRQAVEADPAVEITIDLVNKRVRSSSGLDFGLNMPESARDSLVAGRWDPIQELLDRESDIAKKAKELHYV
jgi:3-isopropylmalate/(R)-2-methylmalate dehydratase small subunit